MTGWPNFFLVVSGGMLAGNELAVAAFVHPALVKISDSSHAESAQMLARMLGRVMPFFYAAVLVFSLIVAWQSGWAAVPVIVAAVYAASIVLTVTALVPINNKIAAMDAARPQIGKRCARVGIIYTGYASRCWWWL